MSNERDTRALVTSDDTSATRVPILSNPPKDIEPLSYNQLIRRKVWDTFESYGSSRLAQAYAKQWNSPGSPLYGLNESIPGQPPVVEYLAAFAAKPFSEAMKLAPKLFAAITNNDETGAFGEVLSRTMGDKPQQYYSAMLWGAALALSDPKVLEGFAQAERSGFLIFGKVPKGFVDNFLTELKEHWSIAEMIKRAEGYPQLRDKDEMNETIDVLAEFLNMPQDAKNTVGMAAAMVVAASQYRKDPEPEERPKPTPAPPFPNENGPWGQTESSGAEEKSSKFAGEQEPDETNEDQEEDQSSNDSKPF